MVQAAMCAIGATFPRTVAAGQVARLHGSKMKPSPSVLKRHRFIFDVCLILLAQESNACAAQYFWADSWPCCGHDWLWTQQHYIADDHLVAVRQASDVFAALLEVTAW